MNVLVNTISDFLFFLDNTLHIDCTAADCELGRLYVLCILKIRYLKRFHNIFKEL